MKDILRTYGVIISVIITIAVWIRSNFIESYQIPSTVMKPNLEEGDLILANKVPFGVYLPFTNTEMIPARRPEDGEMIIYTDPNNSISYVKRALAGPGQKVQVLKGRVAIDGKLLPFYPVPSIGPNCGIEKLPRGGVGYQICLDEPLIPDFGPETVPRRNMFVIADHRTKGTSRNSYEMIPIAYVEAKPVLIWLSFDQNSAIRWDRLLTAPR